MKHLNKNYKFSNSINIINFDNTTIESTKKEYYRYNVNIYYEQYIIKVYAYNANNLTEINFILIIKINGIDDEQ